ncbi:MAG: hypothetical protein IPN53_17170 [Comamonadaceae bacterium]|nr:hypothetical protein [Comamonadaceae bacterium]
MKNLLVRFAALGASLLFGACASAPPRPDWQANAFAALGQFSSAYLEGNSRVADFEFNRAKNEVARTGRPELMARIELVRCALQTASLDFSACTGYQALAVDALAAEQSYADLLAGRWSTLKPDLLPAPYRALVAPVLTNCTQPGQVSGTVVVTTPNNSLLEPIKEPVTRLIAASLLLKMKCLTPADIGLAADTASKQGWRRPLLAWLRMMHQRAQAAGEVSAAAVLQRRIDMVLQTPAH